MDVGAAFPSDSQTSEAVQLREAPLDHPVAGTRSGAVRGAASGNRGDDVPGVGVLVEMLNEVRMNALGRVFDCGPGQGDACDDRVVESPNPLFRRRLLLESLTMLAADAQSQVAWLAKYDVMADEFALDFDHAFRMAERLVEEGQLGRGVLPDLREIHAVLGEMGGAENAGRWTRDALSLHEGWIRARRLARRVLVGELSEWQQPLPEISVIR